jgi:hypothetical protein
MGSIKKTSEEKEAPLKHKGLVTKTSDENRGTPKTQGSRLKRPMKKQAPQKHNGPAKKTHDKNEATLKYKGLNKLLRQKNEGLQ